MIGEQWTELLLSEGDTDTFGSQRTLEAAGIGLAAALQVSKHHHITHITSNRTLVLRCVMCCVRRWMLWWRAVWPMH